MVESSPPGRTDAADDAARLEGGDAAPEQGGQDVAAAKHKGVGGLAAKARAHKVVATVIAIAGFLGLGGIFGQWAVDRVGDLVSGETPPKGFDELHATWEDTASLNEHLLALGFDANENLEAGFEASLDKSFPPELEDNLEGLREVRSDASALMGTVRATDTELTGSRADLVGLVTLIKETAQQVDSEVRDAYFEYGGDPIYGGSAGFAPIFSNDLRADVVKQDELVTQVTAGLRPTARQFDRPIPKIRGWNRLAFPHSQTDTPEY